MQVRDMAVDSESAWWRWFGISLAVTVALIAVLAMIGAVFDPSELVRAVLGLAGEAVLGLVTLRAARQISGTVRRFAADIGLDRISRADAVNWVKGVGWQLLVLFAFGIVVTAVDRHAVHQASNTTGLQHASAAALVLAGIAAVLIAPIVEETQFRALLLRPGIRRYGFTRAAALSSVTFGLLHGWQVHTTAGVIVLVTRMTVFGLVQCLLVRRNGRLAPNVLIHASFNLLALVIAAG
jgi:membrane protease YdiL (CAAX protease family)